MEKIKIMLMQDAYVCCGEYRLHTEDGAPSIYVLRDWYEASAADEAGNEYMVYWKIRSDYDPETMEEDSACQWGSPVEIIRQDNGANVTDEAEIIDDGWNY